MSCRFSIIIPVLDEAGAISGLLEDIERIRGDEKVQLIIVDGDPGGGTIARVEPGRALRLTAPRGRASQMNAGAAKAEGEIFLFLHADTRLPGKALACLDGAVSAGARLGAFDLAIDSDRPVIRAIEALARLRSRLGLPYGDQAQFFTRRAFAELGGFPEIPLMEDVEIMRRARKKGVRPVILSERAVTSARRFEAEGPLRCSARNLALLTLHHLGARPETLARFYRFGRGGHE